MNMLWYMTVLVGRVRNGESTPFRPPLPENETMVDSKQEKIDSRLIDLMREAWHEDPNQRPDIPGVKVKLTTINKGKWVALVNFSFCTVRLISSQPY